MFITKTFDTDSRNRDWEIDQWLNSFDSVQIVSSNVVKNNIILTIKVWLKSG